MFVFKHPVIGKYCLKLLEIKLHLCLVLGGLLFFSFFFFFLFSSHMSCNFFFCV